MWCQKISSQLLLLAIIPFIANASSTSLLKDPNVEIVYIDHRTQENVSDLDINNDIDDIIANVLIDEVDDHEEIRTDAPTQLEEVGDLKDKDDKRGKTDSTDIAGILSANSAKIGTFSPLNCNPATFTNCSALVSNNLPAGNYPLTIPCGQCYTFDLDGNVTLAGLNIEGKLLFPLNHKVNILTPYVIVQGELEISVDHDKITPNNIGTNIILTGTSDVYFQPTKAPNQNACEETGNQCNLGVKPFVVAGGKVDINALPESCSTYTPVLQKKYTDPTYNYKDFPHYVTLPETCPQSGLSFISYNFDNGDYGNWTGRDGAFMEVMDDGSVKVINRKKEDRGPHLDITPIRPDLCLVPDQDYLLAAR